MSYPEADPRTRFRLLLASSLLYLSVAVIILGGLVWYYAEWGLAEVRMLPRLEKGEPLPPWDFLGMVFLSCMIAPVVGMGYDPALRHLSVARHVVITTPVAVLTAVPFWYAAYLPTIALAMAVVDDATLVTLVSVPLPASILTGFLQLMMVNFIMFRSRNGIAEIPEDAPLPPA